MFTRKIATAASTCITAAVIGVAALGLVGTANAVSPAAVSTMSASVVVGDPVGAATYWQRQHGDDCAEMAVADVVGEVTGRIPSEAEIVEVARNTPSTVTPGPIYTGDAAGGPSDADASTGGTASEDIPVLLANYDIAAVLSHAENATAGVDELVADLVIGRKVIVGVNAEIIWGERGDRTTADHAVVVTGIDLAAGLVYLNDSGIDTGRAETISLDVFLVSWSTSDYEMITTL
ncbi:hypothetical protein Rhow_007798 [Rhodococcus wratislaviensis]|uniref:Peptidase C39-like domain-containing protein n=1 Tax=Rhodococcus wratislaviensis TaxID=44752 RepID=A0A402CJ20_RHOWR|nr:hypothetical protein [Rhodococcus wratislaviensis]GCE43568.1 hypothetical protein Rhow_007798 [Rhodococcus wratislaviensis]